MKYFFNRSAGGAFDVEHLQSADRFLIISYKAFAPQEQFTFLSKNDVNSSFIIDQ